LNMVFHMRRSTFGRSCPRVNRAEANKITTG
jgi:hypothetical protein